MGDVVKTVIYLVIGFWLWGKLKSAGRPVNTGPYNLGRRG